MLKSYKYRIYPTDDQIVKLSNIFGQVRFVYNLGLETKINAWKSHRKSISAFDLNNQIKDLKDRDWVCKDCGEIHDRDINAALNIRNFGLRNQPSVTQRKSLDYACGVETQKSLAFV